MTESDREWKGRHERESDREWTGGVRGRLSDREWRTVRVKMLNEFQFLKKFLLETESLRLGFQVAPTRIVISTWMDTSHKLSL